MSTAALPSFLAKLPQSIESVTEGNVPLDCSFEHRNPFGSSHSYWWPPRSGTAPDTLLLFIPGNPGLPAFYLPFLSTIYSTSSEKSLAILAHTHVGYTVLEKKGANWPLEEHVGLAAQVAALIEVIDAIQVEYGSKTSLILVGHSMGSWLATQTLKIRSNVIASLLLLFPTISNIADTPNGVSLSWLFRPPTPYLAAQFSRIALWIPRLVLAKLLPSYPSAQLDVLRSFIASPRAVYTSLTLARDEMRTIRELDALLLQSHAEKLHLYFAERDGWVGEGREQIISVMHKCGTSAVKVVHGPADVPHAFCINHGEVVAKQCIAWLTTGGFV